MSLQFIANRGYTLLNKNFAFASDLYETCHGCLDEYVIVHKIHFVIENSNQLMLISPNTILALDIIRVVFEQAAILQTNKPIINFNKSAPENQGVHFSLGKHN